MVLEAYDALAERQHLLSMVRLALVVQPVWYGLCMVTHNYSEALLYFQWCSKLMHAVAERLHLLSMVRPALVMQPLLVNLWVTSLPSSRRSPPAGSRGEVHDERPQEGSRGREGVGWRPQAIQASWETIFRAVFLFLFRNCFWLAAPRMSFRLLA